MKMNNILSENLKSAREKANLTQEQVAYQLHISRQSISKWENGKSTPDIYTLKNLSALYNISIDELTQNHTIQMDKETTSDSEIKKYLETLIFIILSVLSINIPIIGILIPIFILVYSYRKKKINKLIFIVLCICIIIELYHSFVILNHYYFNLGTSTIEPL